MKKLLIFTSFILSISFSFGQTQGEMNQESFKEYQKSEKELNSVYQKILKEYKSDNIFLSNLRKAQRIWIQFRDAEVKAMYPDREA